MSTHLVDDIPDGPTRRARADVGTHGASVAARPVEEHRQRRLERATRLVGGDVDAWGPGRDVDGDA